MKPEEGLKIVEDEIRNLGEKYPGYVFELRMTEKISANENTPILKL